MVSIVVPCESSIIIIAENLVYVLHWSRKSTSIYLIKTVYVRPSCYRPKKSWNVDDSKFFFRHPFMSHVTFKHTHAYIQTIFHVWRIKGENIRVANNGFIIIIVSDVISKTCEVLESLKDTNLPWCDRTRRVTKALLCYCSLTRTLIGAYNYEFTIHIPIMNIRQHRPTINHLHVMPALLMPKAQRL